MTVIGSLDVNVRANTEHFARGMGKARKELDFFSRSASSVAGMMRGFGATLAAGFTVNALKNTIHAMDDLADAADRLGVSVKALSGLSHAGAMTGVSQEGLFRALTFMEKSVGAGNNVFGSLGLNVSELKQMSADKMFMQIADAINAMPSPAERTAAAMAVFGKSAADLMELIGQGSDGIAEAMGFAFSEEEARQIAEADRAIRHLTATYERWKRIAAIKASQGMLSIGDMWAVAMGRDPPDRTKTFQPVIDSLSERTFAEFRESLAFDQDAAIKMFTGVEFGHGVADSINKAGLLGAVNARTKRDAEELQVTQRRMITDAMQQFSNPFGMGGGTSSSPGIGGMPGMAFNMLWMFQANEMFRRFGGGFADAFDPAAQHRMQQAIDVMLATENAPITKRTRGDFDVRGNAALELGTAAAFSQEKRSNQAANQMIELNKKQLKAQEESVKRLQSIDRNLMQNDTQAANIA